VPATPATDTAARPAPGAADRDGAPGGLEFVRGMVRGEVAEPSLARQLGMRFVSADPGRVVMELVPTELHNNPMGSMHGGVYSTLLDSVCGMAVQTELPAGVWHTSIDLTVKFLRPIGPATAEFGPVRATGTVSHLGGRVALAEARLEDGRGRLCATAVSSIMILRPGRER
jgi:uncharacterized protein (TIGR00369 family)